MPNGILGRTAELQHADQRGSSWVSQLAMSKLNRPLDFSGDLFSFHFSLHLVFDVLMAIHNFRCFFGLLIRSDRMHLIRLLQAFRHTIQDGFAQPLSVSSSPFTQLHPSTFLGLEASLDGMMLVPASALASLEVS
jgi:hypothetical protein